MTDQIVITHRTQSNPGFTRTDDVSHWIEVRSIDGSPINGTITYMRKLSASVSGDQDLIFDSKLPLSSSDNYTLTIYPASKVKYLYLCKNLKAQYNSLYIDSSTLPHAINLEALHLDNINLQSQFVYSDIGQLKQLKSLKIEIDSGESINLSELSELTNLTDLFLSTTNTTIKGNLSALKNMKKLSSLYLESRSIYGNLNDLAGLTNLEQLDLHCPIRGDIKDLTNLVNLNWLNLKNTCTMGDINELSKLTKLKNLFMANAGISGTYSDITKNSDLESLSITNCNAECLLSECAKLLNLEMLVLDNTNSTGSVESLKDSNKLESLSVVNTDIIGDASSLNNLPALRVFSYHHSNVFNKWRSYKKSLYNIQLEKTKHFIERLKTADKAFDVISSEYKNGAYSLNYSPVEGFAEFKKQYDDAMDQYQDALKAYIDQSNKCRQLITEQFAKTNF